MPAPNEPPSPRLLIGKNWATFGARLAQAAAVKVPGATEPFQQPAPGPFSIREMKICVEYEMPDKASVAVPRIWPSDEMIELLAGAVKFRLGPVRSTVNVDERAGV